MTMQVEALELWLGRRLRQDSTVCLLLSPAALLGGLLALFLTYWLAYALSWITARAALAVPELLFGWRGSLGHTGRLWAAAGFVVLLLVTYARSDRRFPVGYGDFEEDDPALLGRTLASGIRPAETSALLLYPGFGARMIVDILSVGPRLLWGAVGLWAEGRAKRAGDAAAGARLLWTLLAAPGKVAYPDLAEAYETGELRRGLLALRGIPGIVFLEQGLSLGEELRAELAALPPV